MLYLQNAGKWKGFIYTVEPHRNITLFRFWERTVQGKNCATWQKMFLMRVLTLWWDVSSSISENQGNEWKKICIYLLLLLISLRMSSTKSDKQTVSFIDTVSVVCCNGN